MRVGPKKGVWNFEALKTPAFIEAGEFQTPFFGPPFIFFSASATRFSRVPRSQPVFDTAVSAPLTPLICSAASTRASASRP